jgi:hypothetical protein
MSRFLTCGDARMTGQTVCQAPSKETFEKLSLVWTGNRSLGAHARVVPRFVWDAGQEDRRTRESGRH